MKIKTLLIISWLIFNSINSQNQEYITGKKFEALADFVITEDATLKSRDHLKNGSIIFVRTDYLEHFFKEIRPTLSIKYILITHNSDLGAPDQFSYILDEDPLLIMWFGQNGTIQNHPKFKSIPIGIANPEWSHGNTDTFDQLSNQIQNTNRDNLVYIGFMNDTHQERIDLKETLGRKSITYGTDWIWDHSSYLNPMLTHKFTVSPRGNGLDCHRTWEALLLGSFPIIKSSSMDELYVDLPVLILNDWEELTPELLEKKYTDMQSKSYNKEKLFFEYWRNLILELKKEYEITYKDNICILSSAALIKHRYEERKEEYINCIKNHQGSGYPLLIAESCELTGSSFLNDYAKHVCYTKSNDYSKKNKGVNEAVSLLKALEYFNIPDDVIVVKITGRYFFQNYSYIQTIANNPDFDAYVKFVGIDDVFTGCYAMRCKNFKDFLRNLDLNDLELREQCIEWEAGRYVNRKIPANRVFKIENAAVSGVLFGEGWGYGLSHW